LSHLGCTVRTLLQLVKATEQLNGRISRNVRVSYKREGLAGTIAVRGRGHSRRAPTDLRMARSQRHGAFQAERPSLSVLRPSPSGSKSVGAHPGSSILFHVVTFGHEHSLPPGLLKPVVLPTLFWDCRGATFGKLLGLTVYVSKHLA
jgi:hypothetical protein